MSESRLFDGSDSPKANVLFAHGAGVGMDSSFMESVARSLGSLGWRVIRFEFPYMQRQRLLGKKRPPDRTEVLTDHFLSEVHQLSTSVPLFIAGKSMGGRVASMIAESLFLADRIRGCVCLGYPFHPLGRPDSLRIEHLQRSTVPVLIVQGERDAMGRIDEVQGYSLARTVQLALIPDGDHSFKPRQRSGHSASSNLELAVETVDHFLCNLL